MSLRRKGSWTPPPPTDEVAAAAAEVVDRLSAQAADDEAIADAAVDRVNARHVAESDPPASPDAHRDECVEEEALVRAELEDAINATATAVEGEIAQRAAESAAVDALATPAKVLKAEIVVHPRTGEAIEVRDAATNVLAALRDAIVDWERSDVARWKHAIDAELRGRLDHESVRSATVGRGTARFRITVPAPTKTVWDAERAYMEVRALVRQGLISETAAGRAVERVVEYKAKHANLKQLAEHADERVRDAIGACRSAITVDPKDRRISVTPVRAGRSDRDDT